MVGLTGCIDGKPNDGVPGDSLGSYSVHATLADSSCGPGAFGAPDAWDFQVKLSREGHTLYWLTGADLVAGTIDDAGTSFSFTAEVPLTITQAKGGQAGCVIVRQDAAQGSLAGTTPQDVPSFAGTLTYGYVPKDGSNCDAIVAEARATGLPCAIKYTMAGTHTGE